jgi:hypothetical protein
MKHNICERHGRTNGWMDIKKNCVVEKQEEREYTKNKVRLNG